MGSSERARGAASVTWQQVIAWRLGRQHLAERAPRKDMLGVAADVCGFPAQVFPTWLAAQRTRSRYYLRPSWLRYFGFTKPAQLERMIDAIGAVLEEAELTREELIAAVGRKTRSKTLAETLRGSWGSALKPAAFTGNLCFA